MDHAQPLTPPSRKLVILRGNSGSGKTTVARRIRESSQRRIAVIEQDYVRRTLLKEREAGRGNVGDLIQLIVGFALGRGYDVIVEGILPFERYAGLLRKLVDGIETTTSITSTSPAPRRCDAGATRPQAREFDEAAMRGWYQAGDVTGLPGERVIPEHYPTERTVRTIRAETGL